MKPSFFSVRMDEKIVLSMLLFCVLACFITAFRYKNDKPCETVDFSVSANNYQVNNYISFSAISSRNADSWQWDFGDKSPLDIASGPYVTHIYKQAGNYDITLTINGKCNQIKSININTVIKDSIPFVIPQVIWPTEPILVGQNVLFRDLTSGAIRWEWYIGEGKDSKQMLTRDAAVTFDKPGNYIVKLIVNGNFDAKIEKTISVKSPARPYTPPIYNAPPRQPTTDFDDFDKNKGIDKKPPFEGPKTVLPQAPPTPIRITLTEAQFLKLIQGVVEGTVIEQDFAAYMCGNSNVRVFYNREDISFHDAIINLQNIKKYKSLEAIAFTNEGTGCIKRISIAVKKKGWLR